MLSTEKIIEIADQHSTPLYILDKEALENRINEIKAILGEGVTLCYAMKANPFFVDAFKHLNTKYEVCSPGEFAICEREKVNMKDIVLSGVNKEKADICHVLNDCGGVGVYTVESKEQYSLLSECAREAEVTIDVLLRVTSGNQFGLDEEDIKDIVKNREKYPELNIRGVQCYTGTQKKKFDIIKSEIEWLDGLCDSLYADYGFKAEELEYGPGLPVSYFGDAAYDNKYDMLKELAALLENYKAKYSITLEMGRYLVAECGIYVTGIADIKKNKGQQYVIVDGGINHVNYYGQAMAMKKPRCEFIPMEYTEGFADGADHEVEVYSQGVQPYNICGSLCTVGDVIVKNLELKDAKIGDMIAFYNIGAYSVTEGIYLFLSRRMPAIVMYSKKNGYRVIRKPIETFLINSSDTQ